MKETVYIVQMMESGTFLARPKSEAIHWTFTHDIKSDRVHLFESFVKAIEVAYEIGGIVLEIDAHRNIIE